VEAENVDAKDVIIETTGLIDNYMKDTDQDGRSAMQGFLLMMDVNKLKELANGFSCTRPHERMNVVFSEISPHAFSKFDKRACMVDSAKDFPRCFFEYLFTKAYLKGIGSWDWVAFKKTIETVQLIQEIRATENHVSQPNGRRNFALAASVF